MDKVTLIKELFVNRKDCWARQYLAQNNKKKFKRMDSEISDSLIEKHLESKEHMGVYQLEPETNLVKWGVLDFDENTPEDFEKAKKIYSSLRRNGFNPLMEKSGGGEYKVHIWIFSREPIKAKIMKDFLEYVCIQEGLKPHEIFPKQTEISKEEYGNLLKLPLGEHLVTKKKSVFLDEDFKEDIDFKALVIASKNKDDIPLVENTLSEQKESINQVKIKLKPHKWDSFFKQTLKQDLPEGISKEAKIGNKEAGINNNLLKNQARWFYEKGYSEELLRKEIKPIFDSNNWAFNDLLGWFRKCQKGQILEINKKELSEWIKNYYPSLEFFLPSKQDEIKNTQPGAYELRTYEDFKNLKKDKNFIIDGFLYPGSVTMVYSPPAQFKSLISCYMGLAISNGKEFLGMKTKKMPVLYGDGENARLTIKDRLEKIHKGMNLKRNKFPYYTLTEGLLMDEKKNIHLGFQLFIEKEIEEKGIKVLIFDTMHRFAYYDENSSDDINRLYTKFFKPLAEKYNVAIVFLHHSTKSGGYRGSGDFLGMVDVSYQIRRKPKTNHFTIINEKSRNGEIAEIQGEIVFDDEYIKLHRLDEKEEQENAISKLKETTTLIKEYFQKLNLFDKKKKKEVSDYFELNDVTLIESTFKRSLKFLVDNGFLDTDSRGKYWRIKE
jgi:hypothetical protein